MTSYLEDDLKNGRQPQKWKRTSKMEDDLKNGRLPQKWKTTSKMEDGLRNGRRPQKWKMTSKMEDDFKNGRRPQKRKTTSFPLPSLHNKRLCRTFHCKRSCRTFHNLWSDPPTDRPTAAMTLGTLVPHGTKNGGPWTVFLFNSWWHFINLMILL